MPSSSVDPLETYRQHLREAKEFWWSRFIQSGYSDHSAREKFISLMERLQKTYQPKPY